MVGVHRREGLAEQHTMATGKITGRCVCDSQELCQFPRLTPLCSVISSKPFRFIVGPQKREFTIHSALVAHQSRALNTLVNGVMQEAQDGYATWEHVDERTFVRFSQYAYTGDYHGAAPFLPASTTSNTVPNGPGHPESSGKLGATTSIVPNGASLASHPVLSSFFTTNTLPNRASQPVYEPSPPKTPTSTKRDILWDAFENAQCYNLGNHSLSAPRKNTNPREEYAGVFLSHARLYVFADCYGILRLERLSFTKLHRALVAFELYDARIDGIIELLRYCYEDAAPERLRGLVVHFAACHVEKLCKSDDFQTLLEAHGELSKALVGKLLARLD